MYSTSGCFAANVHLGLLKLVRGFMDLYAGQSIEALIALGASGDVFDSVDLIRQGIGHKVIRERRRPTLAEALLDAIPEFEGNVKNGGFAQALVNASSRYADVIVPALEVIGCSGKARVTAGALAAVPDWKERTFEELDVRLGSFDQDYFRLDSDEDTVDAVFRFVVGHQSELQLP